jgi:hypothetical protein
MDPFWAAQSGQSLPSLTPTSNNPRFVNTGSWTNYNIDPTNDVGQSCKIVQTFTNSLATSQATTTSFTGAVTDVITNSDTFSEKAGLFGLSIQGSLASTESQSSNTQWTVNYQTSASATSTIATAIGGTISDNESLPYPPGVEVYQDNVFGSYLYQDIVFGPNQVADQAPGPIPSDICVFPLVVDGGTPVQEPRP